MRRLNDVTLNHEVLVDEITAERIIGMQLILEHRVTP
jgi:hypothetical protein